MTKMSWTNPDRSSYQRDYKKKNRDKLNEYRRKWRAERKKKELERAQEQSGDRHE
jgi:hypothetical protein